MLRILPFAKSYRPGLASLALWACAAGPAVAATYSFQAIAVSGDNFTQTLGIDNAGTIVGYHGANTSATNPNKGFVFTQPNTFTDQNFPGSVQTQVVGINNNGATVGFFVDAAGVNHGFERNGGGVFSAVDAPGTSFNQLLGINDLNVAAGYSSTDPAGATLQRAFLRQSNGSFSYLDGFLPVGTQNNQATDVNNAGNASGFYVDSGGLSHGFVLAGSVLTSLDFPGSTGTQALGLNNAGQVDGFYLDAGGLSHGFVEQGGIFQSVDVPGALQTTINGINDKGQIVGFFLDANENTVGFVGMPSAVPEPASAWLMVTGLMGFVATRRFRKKA